MIVQQGTYAATNAQHLRTTHAQHTAFRRRAHHKRPGKYLSLASVRQQKHAVRRLARHSLGKQSLYLLRHLRRTGKRDVIYEDDIANAMLPHE